MTDLLPKIDEILKAVWYSGKNESQVFDFFECLSKENWDSKILAAINEDDWTPPDKERQILESLHSKEYREALAVEHVNTTLAIQIRNMREKQQWNQSDLANRLGKHRETISQWENPDYGQQNITALKALAATFDVALLVKFVPFSELVKDMVNLSESRLSPPGFNEEQ